MLKTKMIALAGSLGLALAGIAAGPAVADLDKRLMRTNVECGGSYVTGFTLILSEVQQFIGAAAAEHCGDAADVARYTVVPASVDMLDLGEVLAYLELQGEVDVAPQLRTDSGCRVSASDVDPDGDGGCFVDDGLEGSVGVRANYTRKGVNGGW